MILQAGNGCYLTENFEVDINERRFLKSINVADMEEAVLWKEVTEAEKDYMIEQGKLFCPDSLSYDYLENLNSLLGNVSQMINDLDLTSDQALKMKRFYPQWEDVLGIEAECGFKLNYNDILLEVVTPHTLSNDNLPTQRPMILSVSPDTDESSEVIYFRPVLPETVEPVGTEPINVNNEENVND